MLLARPSADQKKHGSSVQSNVGRRAEHGGRKEKKLEGIFSLAQVDLATALPSNTTLRNQINFLETNTAEARQVSRQTLGPIPS